MSEAGLATPGIETEPDSGAPEGAGGPPNGPDPTLLDLARDGSRWARVGMGVIAIGVIVSALSVTVLRPGKPKGGAANVRIAGTSGFAMEYARGELRVVTATPQRVELTDRRDEEQGSRLIVTPLELGAYKGSPTGALPMASQRAKAVVEPRFDAGSVRWADEGLVGIGPNPGYQLSYVAKRDGATWYGRAAIAVPDVDGRREAWLIDGEEQRIKDGKISGPRAVGRSGDLRRPMKSFDFLD